MALVARRVGRLEDVARTIGLPDRLMTIAADLTLAALPAMLERRRGDPRLGAPAADRGAARSRFCYSLVEMTRFLRPGSSARRVFVAALLCVLVITGGCSSVQRTAAAYDPSRHGDFESEWGPHRGVVEWWYLTAVLAAPVRREGIGRPATMSADREGLFLAQFTIFHFDLKPVPLYMLHLACTEYGAQRHLFEQYVSFDAREAFGEGAAVVYGSSRIELLPEGLRVIGRGTELSMDLAFEVSEPAVWHGGDGIISMGHPEDPGEDSFYCSLTRMGASGSLSIRSPSGEWASYPVAGDGWLDRQWGDFEERGWEWFSLRFFDGDRIMLFSFPGSGHREGTFDRADGQVANFDDFEYSVDRWVERGGRRYGLGWQLELPVKDGRYRVIPLYQEDFNPNPANDYWEGLCSLLDAGGTIVGWCVAETTAPAHSP